MAYQNSVQDSLQSTEPQPKDKSQNTYIGSSTPPWHYNDTFLSKLTEQELKSIIEPLSPAPFGLAFGNDNCPIHPIFNPLTNLATSIPLLVPTLRLATRFLLSRHTLPFFHQLATCPLTLLQNESVFYNSPIYHIPQLPFYVTGLNENDRQLTIQTLLALSDHVTIQVSPDPRLNDRWAYTERFIPSQPSQDTGFYGDGVNPDTLPRLNPIPHDLHQPYQQQIPLTPRQSHFIKLNFRGTNAFINLSPSFFHVLRPSTLPQATYTTQLRCCYFLAVTLIHELAHAVWMCRVPPPSFSPFPPNPLLPPSHNPVTTPEYEPFHSHDRQSELGYALETTLFHSGHILPLGQSTPPSGPRCPDFSLGLGWTRWPGISDFFVSSPYVPGEAVPLARLHRSSTRKGEWKITTAPKWETVYVVPHVWIWRQFFREFWDEFDRTGIESGLLRIDKAITLGVRRRNVDFGLLGLGRWGEQARGRGGFGGVGVGIGVDMDGDGEEQVSSFERGADELGVVRFGLEFVESEDDEGEDELHGSGDEDMEG